MTKFLDELYYQDNADMLIKETSSLIPGSSQQLDVNHSLSEGAVYWKQHEWVSRNAEKKPKNIVVNCQFTIDSQHGGALQLLAQRGHPIFVVTKEKDVCYLKPLTAVMATQLFLYHTRLVTTEVAELINAAQMDIDHCLILNDKKIQKLTDLIINEEDEDVGCLPCEEHAIDLSRIDFKKNTIQFIVNSLVEQEFSTISISFIASRHDERIENLQKLLALNSSFDLLVTTCFLGERDRAWLDSGAYRNLHLKSTRGESHRIPGQVATLNLPLYKNLVTMIFGSDRVFEPEAGLQFEKLEHLEFDAVSLDILHKWLTVSVALKTLKVKHSLQQGKKLDYTSFELNLPNLKEIEVGYIDPSYLKHLIDHAPNLERWSLTQVNSALIEQSIDLSKLISFIAVASTHRDKPLHFNELNTIFAQAKNLSHLRCWDVIHSAEESLPTLDKLEELETHLNMAFFSLMRQCPEKVPNLKRLTVYSGDVVQESVSQSLSSCFKSLEYLELSITGPRTEKKIFEQLWGVLAQVPTLSEFVYENSAEESDLIDFESREAEGSEQDEGDRLKIPVFIPDIEIPLLPELKTVKIIDAILPARALQALLNAAINLRELEFKNAVIVGDFSGLAVMKNLESLTINNIDFSDDSNKECLLKAMPNVKVLTINSWVTKDICSLVDILKSVRQLNSHMVSSGKLLTVLQRFPRIQHVFLDDLKNADEKSINDYGQECWMPYLHKLSFFIDDVARINGKDFNSAFKSNAVVNETLDTNTVENPEDILSDIKHFQRFFTGEVMGSARQRITVYPIGAEYPVREGELFCYVTPTEDMLIDIDYESWDDLDATPQCIERFKQQEDFNLDSFYRGVVTLDLNHIWQPMPSFSVYDCLYAVHGQDVQVKYSTYHRQYFARSSTAGEIKTQKTIHYLFQSTPVCSHDSLPSDLCELVGRYRAFGSGRLQVPPNANNLEIIQAIQTQQVGACRHRTAALLEEIKRLFTSQYPKMRCFAVFNSSHAFVELDLGDELFYRLDLSGFRGTLRPPDIHLIEAPIDNRILQAPDSLKPWLKQKKCSYQEILENLMCFSTKRTRVTFQDEPTCTAFSAILQCAYLEKETPCFYIEDPEELRCQQAQVVLNAHYQADFKKAPAGLLFEFIAARKVDKRPSVLVIRWSRFNPDKVIQSNTVLDNDEPNVEGILLPHNMQVVSLHNIANPTAYLGSDFISRHDKLYACGAQDRSLLTAAELLFTPSSVTSHSDRPQHAINLYHNESWQPLLYGQLSMGEMLMYRRSLLTALDKSQAHLVIQNKPESESFEYFMRQLKLNDGKATIFGRDFDFSGIHFTYEEGYDWSYAVTNARWLQAIEPPRSLPRQTFVLNVETATLLWQAYAFTADIPGQMSGAGKAISLPGYLAQHAREGVFCYVTHPLPLDIWSRVFDTAKMYDVWLNVLLAPGVFLPLELDQAGCTIVPHSVDMDLGEDSASQIICTNDIAFTTRQSILQQTTPCFVKEITESDISTLLCEIEANLSTEPVRFNLTWIESDVYKALLAGETVILKGKLSLQKKQQLASLLSPTPHFMKNNTPVYFPGKIILITDGPAKDFQFAPAVREVMVSRSDYWEYLSTCYPIEAIAALQANIGDSHPYTLSQLEALLKSPELSWEPLQQATKPLDLELTRFRVETAEAEHALRQATQTAALLQAIETHPTVVIVGPTGSGKTTTLERLAKNKDTIEVFWGLDKLKTWAMGSRRDSTKKRILVLDEAMTDALDHTQFEDLYNPIPGIWIKGTFYPLSSNDIVAFTCNPESYGKRKIPSLFKNHGGILEYTNIPAASLYINSLKPIFDTLPQLPEKSKNYCAYLFLQVYAQILQLSSDKVRISPRELEFMALVFAAECSSQAIPDVFTIALNVSVLIAENLLLDAKEKESFYDWFQTRTGFPMARLLENMFGKLVLKAGEFVFVPEHSMSCLLMNSLLKSKAYRAAHRLTVQGLSQFILEGGSGLGKSVFILNFLRMKGYTFCEVFDRDLPLKPEEKRCYYLPAKLSFDLKKQVLDCALKQNAVVVCDEINSQSLEPILNSFSSEITSDGQILEYTKSVLIGTQNDAKLLRGRHEHSNAEQRRQLKVFVAPYSKESLQRILLHWGLDAPSAAILANQYQVVVEYATLRNLMIPTLRDLKREVDLCLKAKQLQTGLSISKEELVALGYEQMEESDPLREDVPALLFMQGSVKRHNSESEENPERSVKPLCG